MCIKNLEILETRLNKKKLPLSQCMFSLFDIRKEVSIKHLDNLNWILT